MNARTPPGWYDDPQSPGMLRYWTGDAWSEHTAPPPTARPASTSGLSELGPWLGSCFSMPWARRAQLLPLLALAVVAWVLTMALLLPVFDGVVIVNDSFTGWDGGRTIQLISTMAISAVASGIVVMAVAHQMYFARLGVHQPVAASLTAALGALPRAIGWLLVLGLALVGVIFGFALLAIAGLGANVVFIAIGLAVFAVVKLAFLTPALVIPIPERNPIQASADVSAGRFWAVLGRLVLLGIMIGIGSAILGSALQAATGAGGDGNLDANVQVDSNSGTIEFADLEAIADELDPLDPLGVLVQIPGILASFIGITGGAILFAERHQHRPSADPSRTA